MPSVAPRDCYTNKLELIQFLQDNKIDVLLVSETHCTIRTVLKIPNYLIYHCHHPDGTPHGGAAIPIPTAVKRYEAPAYQTDKIQAAIIQIKAQPWPFNIAAMYSPPRHKIEAEDYKKCFPSSWKQIYSGRRLER